jgi:hypothetical protein
VESLSQNKRVTVMLKVRRGVPMLDGICFSDDVPEGQLMEEWGKVLYNEAAGLAKELSPEPSQLPASNGQAVTCPICSAEMRMSKSGKTWQCTNAKWSSDNGEWVNSGCQGKRSV